MANFLRMLIGLALLPLCCGVFCALSDVIILASGSESVFSINSLSLISGIVVFFFCWCIISKPVKAYVLGHELTHAMWGLMFGAVPSKLKVGKNGGSVMLTKTNIIIALAPYFFPFYTFLVIVSALITYAFVRPLPCLPLWLFAIGFTWAFHILWTLETLSQRQPDVMEYGRLFSWVFIFIINLLLVIVWLVCTSKITFAESALLIGKRIIGCYGWLFSCVADTIRYFRTMGE